MKKISKFLRYLVYPKSTKDLDKGRKEFILNVILASVILLSLISFLTNLTYFLFAKNYVGNFPLVSFIIFLFFCSLFLFSKIGQAAKSAVTFISFLLIASILTSLKWGTDIPQILLMYSLIIVISGILVNARFLLIVTIIIAGTLFILSYLQLNNIFVPDTNWRTQPFKWGDSIIRLLTLVVIGLVSWLFEDQITKSLTRATESEKALAEERDLLEVRVKERTEELKQVQAEKLIQLYHFAEVGRYASGLFHDLVNPLTLVSLNLSKLKKESKYFNSIEMAETKKMINRALIGTKKLQDYVKVARMQIKNIENSHKFPITKEIDQAIELLWHKIDQTEVKIISPHKNSIELYGNPIKFNQVIMNLLSNAIDAYSQISRELKLIKIELINTKTEIKIKIQDWGVGIDEYNYTNIFKPLFTTKAANTGTGLGLFITKNIIEKEFKGQISFNSQKGKGTTFVITIPISTH